MKLESPSEALRRSAAEPAAFAIFYDAHAKALLIYLARRACDPEVAADVTAESFARAFTRRKRFRGSTDGEAAAWLYTTADRELARYFRKGKVERRALRRLGVQAPYVDDEQQARIEELASLTDLRDAVRAALESISEANREALRLRVVEDVSYPEIARRLHISEPAARARVSRGLKFLASALNRDLRAKEQTA